MEKLLTRSWWALALHGVCALVFGVLAVAWPGITLGLLVALFAAYALVSGVAAVTSAIRHASDKGWWLLLVLGLASIGAGVLTLVYPDFTALFLILIVGANAIVTGVLQIAMAFRLRKEIRGEWLLGGAGAVSVVFGALMMLFPGLGALALVWLIALYAVTSGVLLLRLAWRAHHGMEPWHGAPTGAV